MSGWVENVPGTCRAGGPPPICPANHWHRDANSIQEWRQRLKELVVKRTRVLLEERCDCLAESAAESLNLAAVARNTSATNRGEVSGSLGVCETDGHCPPGLSCQNKRCVVPSKIKEVGAALVKTGGASLRMLSSSNWR